MQAVGDHDGDGGDADVDDAVVDGGNGDDDEDSRQPKSGDTLFLLRFVSFASPSSGSDCSAQAMSCRALRATGELGFSFTVRLRLGIAFCCAGLVCSLVPSWDMCPIDESEARFDCIRRRVQGIEAQGFSDSERHSVQKGFLAPCCNSPAGLTDHAQPAWDALSWRCRLVKFPHFRLKTPLCPTATLL